MENKFMTGCEPVIDASKLTREEWLRYRQSGIGGSDAPVIMGASNWKSLSQLWREKMNLVPLDKEADKQFTLDYGNRIEPVIRRWFGRKFGYEVWKDSNLYRSKKHPVMIADADFFFTDRRGKICGGEIKTTNPRNSGNWKTGVLGDGGVLPEVYEWQVRHYMRVFDLPSWYVICLYGNTPSETAIVRVDRQRDMEDSLISAERDFWATYILGRTCPQERQISEGAMKSLTATYLEKTSLKSEEEKPRQVVREFPGFLKEDVEDYLNAVKKRKEIENVLKEAKEKENALSVGLREEMSDKDKAYLLTSDDEGYEISFARQWRKQVNYDKLALVYPEAYKDCVSLEESRTFSVKEKTGKQLKKLVANK